MPISFEEFRVIWCSQMGQPAKYDTFKKFQHLSVDDCKTALQQLFSADQDGFQSTLTPKIKRREYLENLPEGKLDLSALALDKSESLHVVIFNRQSVKVGNETAHRDSLCVKKSQAPGRQIAASDIIKAYKDLQEIDDIAFDVKQGELLQVYSKSASNVASMMIISSFVETMRRKLGCKAKDDLIAVPFTSDMIYATKSSSYLGCCMLGDFCDALNARKEIADYVTSVPYRVASMDKTQTVETILSQNKPPVLWEYYPYWGQKPNISMASSDGKVRFAIPGSEAQANEFLNELRAGKRPTVILHEVVRVDGSKFGNCSRCFQAKELLLCARCNMSSYCSKDCQRKHWKLHKLQCRPAT